MTSVSVISHTLAALTILGQGVAVLIFIGILTRRSFPAWAERGAYTAAAIVALVSMTGSLFFSEVAKYQPCELCWYQRILMYPQVLLLALGSVRKDKNIPVYILILSVLGLVLAAYHYSIQLGATPLAPCSTTSFAGVSCTAKQTMMYGYVTIPVMAGTAFALIIEAMVIVRRRFARPNAQTE